jgi:NADPH:quinone reductase
VRALRCTTHGGTDSLVIEDLPDPVPGPGEVLVRVVAASVNYPDVLICRNEYQIRMPAPFTPGSDFAGVVEAVGQGADPALVGRRVCGTVFVGAFAERLVAPAASCIPVPDEVDDEAAAAFPVVYGTAYDALRSRGSLAAGETLVVLGAAGGVGSAAVQLGVAMGARVIACASSPEKLSACRALGAAATVDYATEDLKARLKELGGADVVVDPVGGPYSEAALRACNYGARFVVVGFAAKDIPRIPLNLVLLKSVSVVGYEIGSFMRNEPEAVRRNRAELLALLAEGRIRPLIGGVHPLDEAAEAMRRVFERESIGKVVIRPWARDATS